MNTCEIHSSVLGRWPDGRRFLSMDSVAAPEMATAEPPAPVPGAKAALNLVGSVAVAAALAASELLAGLLTSVPSLVGGVATFVIDTVPKPIKDFAIRTFGVHDKAVLGFGIVAVAIIVGSRVRRRSALALFGGFGLLAALATARSPQVGVAPSLLNGALAAGMGLWVWTSLSRTQVATDHGRRRLLLQSFSVLGLALLAAAGGRVLGERARLMLARRDEVTLPVARESVAAPTAKNVFDVADLSPLVVPNDRFYRIDTAPFNPPQVDLTTWTLTIKGMVDRPLTFTYDDILEMGLVERYITLSCVSNEVGGGLVGNAKWMGYPLADLLNRAGVQRGAEQVVGRSVDGFTVGFPVDAVFDGREALLAVGMNDEPLPFDHGFPARLVVAGLYGYVSATKWLSEVELTTWDGFDAYWIPRGWAKEAPVKTQSRIDTPRRNTTIAAGVTAIAGVAWAPNRGISRVEVRVEGGDWVEAEVTEPLTKDAWVQWKLPWKAASGSYAISVRATDGEGVTQTKEVTPPAPDGATGHHTIRITVS